MWSSGGRGRGHHFELTAGRVHRLLKGEVSLPNFSPEQKTENSVRTQSQERGRPSFVKAEKSFSCGYFVHAIENARIFQSSTSLLIDRLVVKPSGNYIEGRHKQSDRQSA